MFDFTYTEKDLDFDVTEQLRRMVTWEVWDKMARDTLNSIANLNPVQIDTLCDYLRMLVPPSVEVERTLYGCILNSDNNRIFVVITSDDIIVKSFEQLPRSSFMFDVLKYTGKYTHGTEYDWEYHFELPEVLKDEHRDSV